jgi:hypothetical protein
VLSAGAASANTCSTPSLRSGSPSGGSCTVTCSGGEGAAFVQLQGFNANIAIVCDPSGLATLSCAGLLGCNADTPHSVGPVAGQACTCFTARDGAISPDEGIPGLIISGECGC